MHVNVNDVLQQLVVVRLGRTPHQLRQRVTRRRQTCSTDHPFEIMETHSATPQLLRDDCLLNYIHNCQSPSTREPLLTWKRQCVDLNLDSRSYTLIF